MPQARPRTTVWKKGGCTLMGNGKGYQKRVGCTKRCAWCGMIRLGGAWIPERRSHSSSIYTHGICEICREQFLAEAAGRS